MWLDNDDRRRRDTRNYCPIGRFGHEDGYTKDVSSRMIRLNNMIIHPNHEIRESGERCFDVITGRVKVKKRNAICSISDHGTREVDEDVSTR